MAQAVDDPGESHRDGWAVTPCWARAQHLRNSPWRPSSRPANGLGYAGAHNLSISWTPRACCPKGSTTVRAGGVKRRPDLNALSPNALSPQALRPARVCDSESGPGLGVGPRKTRGLTTRLVRVGKPANLNRAREEALRSPEPQAGKRWCLWGVEGAGPYIRARVLRAGPEARDGPGRQYRDPIARPRQGTGRSLGTGTK
jgi:hypothetical protein